MRAPSAPFCTALAAYVFAREQAGITQGAQRDKSFTGADRKLIDRWKTDDRAEKLWKSIKDAVPPDTIQPVEFIEIVVKARRSAQASVNRMYGTKGIRGNFAKFGPDGGIVYFKRELMLGFKREWAAALPDLKKTLSKKLSQSPASIGPLEVASILERAAEEVRNLHRFHFGFADHLGLPGPKKFELSRKDQNGSRVRRLFVQIVSHYLHQRCGKRFDEQVAYLAEIAFPGGKELHPEDIKKARRGTFNPQSRG
jgi:hypothetical protein